MSHTIKGRCAKCNADKNEYYYILSGTEELIETMSKAEIKTEPIFMQKINKKSQLGKVICDYCYKKLH